MGRHGDMRLEDCLGKKVLDSNERARRHLRHFIVTVYSSDLKES
jgi:hypothetical protein